MKKKPIQILMVITISASILVFPACLHSSDLAGVRLLSTDLSLENPSQDDTLSYQPGQSKAFVSTVVTLKSLPGTILSNQIAHVWLLVSFADQKALLLRC
jgi:hypothetical protein